MKHVRALYHCRSAETEPKTPRFQHRSPLTKAAQPHNKAEEGSWMFPEPLGAFSSLWECRAEGKQRLKQGVSPDLAPELSVLQFRRSQIF